MKIIQEIINKIQQIIGQITSNLPEFLKDLEEKIKEIISGLNLDDLIEKIKEAIKNGLGPLAEHAKECIEAETEAIKQLAQDEQAGAQACVQAAVDKTQALQAQIDKLLARANEIRQDVIDRVEKCFKEHHLKPAELVDCLKSQVEPIKGELQQIEKEVEKLVAEAQTVAQEAAAELNTCMSNLAQELATKEQAIIEDIKKCMTSQ